MSNVIRVEAATWEDCAILAQVMRQADVDEILASGYSDPLDALVESVAKSNGAWSVFLHGELSAMCGVQSLGEDVGVPWILTGHAVDDHRKAFLLATRDIRDVMLRRYRVLVQVIDERHTRSLRWAQWLGFKVGDTVPFGPENRPFKRVSFERSS